MSEPKTLCQKMIAVQAVLKAPKNQRNTFGNYDYRSCEDILEAVKPHLVEHGILVTLSDELTQVGDRFYVKAIATAKCGDETLTATAYSREQESKKGMDGSQITGAASSYARKYALNGLFLIDDNKDSDGKESKTKGKEKAVKQPEKQSEATGGSITGIPSDYKKKTGEKNGNKWVKHGFQIDGNWYATFSETDTKTLRDSMEQGYQVVVTYTAKGNYKTIAKVVVADG